MLPQTLPRAIETATALVEAVDEPWLYRYAAQSLAPPENTVTGNEVHPQWDVPNYVIQDKADHDQWVQSDTYLSVEDCR